MTKGDRSEDKIVRYPYHKVGISHTLWAQDEIIPFAEGDSSYTKKIASY